MQENTEWIQTRSGKQFYPLDPRIKDIDIRDIDNALAIESRFNGHTFFPYSIAQHSLLVSKHCKNPLLGLLHDSPEAYLKDIPKPIKNLFFISWRKYFFLPKIPIIIPYKKAENRLLELILKKYGNEPTENDWEDLRINDMRALATEQRDLMGKPPVPWPQCENVEPFEDAIYEWPWTRARNEFMYRFKELI